MAWGSGASACVPAKRSVPAGVHRPGALVSSKDSTRCWRLPAEATASGDVRQSGNVSQVPRCRKAGKRKSTTLRVLPLGNEDITVLQRIHVRVLIWSPLCSAALVLGFVQAGKQGGP